MYTEGEKEENVDRKISMWLWQIMQMVDIDHVFVLISVKVAQTLIYLKQVKLGSSPSLKAALWNARSVRNKTVSVHDFVLENELDILFITESWLGRDDSVIIGELTPPMYSFINVPRPNSTTYGGIGILFKSCLKLQHRSTDKHAVTFEHAIVMDISRCIQYVIIYYRPPPSSKNGCKTTDFLYEFESFVSDVNLAANKTVIMGDFNLHIDLPSKPEIVSFMSILSSFDLFQHVSESTHVHGHMLDLLISREGGDIIHNCGVRKCLESDHYVVEFDISKQRPAKQYTERLIWIVLKLILKISSLIWKLMIQAMSIQY